MKIEREGVSVGVGCWGGLNRNFIGSRRVRQTPTHLDVVSSVKGAGRQLVTLGAPRARANCFSLRNVPTDGAGLFKTTGSSACLSLEDVGVPMRREVMVCRCLWKPLRAAQGTRPSS